jgi:hypothetical protein
LGYTGSVLMLISMARVYYKLRTYLKMLYTSAMFMILLFSMSPLHENVLNPGYLGISVCFSNACPVKEEVVAPFWANNTRGEVLALLNLYPFEQYVHWEKCT